MAHIPEPNFYENHGVVKIVFELTSISKFQNEGVNEGVNELLFIINKHHFKLSTLNFKLYPLNFIL